MRPATRIPLAPRRTTATALLPAMATYSVRPSEDRASALGSLPGGASGASATVSCSRTWPVARSTLAAPFAPASATSSSEPRRARAEGWGPTKTVDRETGGLTARSMTERGVAPVADVERATVCDGGVGAVTHGHDPTPLERGGVDEVDRIAQVADHGHQTLPRQEHEAGGVELRAGIGERHAVPDPRRAALPREAIHPVGRTAARPHGVAPVPTGARQAEPRRRQRHVPHDLSPHGVDAHQTVLAVAVVADDDGPIGERHEVQGQRADRDDTPGGTDPPAGGKQRGPVRQRARDETRGEERDAGDGWEREQGALEHGPEYGRSRERWHPLSLRRDDRADLSSDPAHPLGP